MNTNVNYRFDNFIVGDCNKDAYNACKAVVDGSEGSLVVIHGPSSCGKTHLLFATQRAFCDKYPQKKVFYTTFENLAEKYVEAIRAKEAFDYSEICKNDLLIVDNMQFAAGKRVIQQEFANWFAEMLDMGKSVIIALDSHLYCVIHLMEALNQNYAAKCKIIEISAADASIRKKHLENLIGGCAVELSKDICDDLINSKEIPFSGLKGFLSKLDFLQNQKQSPLSQEEILLCLNDYKYNS